MYNDKNSCPIQWRIQDFPEGGANPEIGAKTYYLARFLPKTAWKWKITEGEGVRIPSGLLSSANAINKQPTETLKFF